MFKTRVVSDNGLARLDGGTSIDVRLPWYRALPLSTVEIAEVIIDGKSAPIDELRFRLNEMTLQASELASRSMDWWFVLDSGLIEIPGLLLEPGTEHEVSVTIGLRPPYIPGFFRMTECTKRLTVHAGPPEGK